MSAHGVLLLTVRVGLCGVRSSRGWALLSISSCWQRGMPRRHSQTPQSTRTSPRYPNHSPSTNFNFFYTRSCKFNNILRAKREISKNIAFLVVTVIAAFFVNCRLEKWNLYWNANRRTPCLCLTVFFPESYSTLNRSQKVILRVVISIILETAIMKSSHRQPFDGRWC